uniref:SFRICE_001129 n=1 Tax=Spodoptera frugiperda TaxID=7108 RepID=A0A2H1VFS5_SPOFR
MSGTKDNVNKEEPDCDCYADARTKKTCPPTRNVTHPLPVSPVEPVAPVAPPPHVLTSPVLLQRYYEFTQEEMKALEECDTESFYQRCLPFSAILATLTYTAIKNDMLRPNPHFGSVPKMGMAIFTGYVLGRLSYLSHCDEKLRQLPPSSHLGNVMRKYYADNIAYNTPKPPKK